MELLLQSVEEGVVQVSAGVAHTCALLDNGKATCWGAGSNGQLGDGSPNWSTPQAVLWPDP